ncbi:MAG TPA: 5,6-dimethylbenzimidazole synthase [Verrucomicrobiae bacterium]|nr:5,6-dimethylbenzimidazole synthase [Verrucomicrobiae bacterium]
MSNYSNREFSEFEKDVFYDVIFSRRDVRQNFIVKKIEDNTLLRILKAAHHAPSVGFSQPWNFILIKNRTIRERIKESFLKERIRSIDLLNDEERQKKYLDLKLEGILESDINICVTYDHKRFGPFVIGRMTIKDAGIYSVCCAIQNLWLASRVEGIGVGWVSILNNEEIVKTLNLPDDVKPIAYLCLGYVEQFNDSPDLEKKNWLNRLSLKDVIFFERWDDKINDNWKNLQYLLS